MVEAIGVVAEQLTLAGDVAETISRKVSQLEG